MKKRSFSFLSLLIVFSLLLGLSLPFVAMADPPIAVLEEEIGQNPPLVQEIEYAWVDGALLSAEASTETFYMDKTTFYAGSKILEPVEGKTLRLTDGKQILFVNPNDVFQTEEEAHNSNLFDLVECTVAEYKVLFENEIRFAKKIYKTEALAVEDGAENPINLQLAEVVLNFSVAVPATQNITIGILKIYGKTPEDVVVDGTLHGATITGNPENPWTLNALFIFNRVDFENGSMMFLSDFIDVEGKVFEFQAIKPNAPCQIIEIRVQVVFVDEEEEIRYTYDACLYRENTHTFGEWIEEVPATCTEAGILGHYHCDACGKDFDENLDEILDLTVEMLPHTPAETPIHEVKEPTCSEPGLDAWVVYCSACGEEIERDGVEIPTLSHTYSEWIEEITPENCTETGVLGHYHCEACGKNFDANFEEIEDLIIYPRGHEYIWYEEIPATCTATGVLGHYHCEICGRNFDADFEEIEVLLLPMAEHAYDTWTNEIPATCTTNGRKGFQRCRNCGKLFDENGEELGDLTIPSPGHVYEWNEEIPATCKETGAVAHYHCAGCDRDFDANYKRILDIVLPKTDHTYGEWETEIPATCTEEGVKGHYCCNVCQKNFDEEKNELATLVIPFVEHTFTQWIDEIPAACETNGVKGHYSCSVCGKNFDAMHIEIADLTIPSSVAHSYSEWVDEIPPTCIEEGVAGYYKCNICGKLFDENFVELNTLVLPATGEHIPGEWNYDNKQHWYYCVQCNVCLVKSNHTMTWGLDARAQLTASCDCGYSKSFLTVLKDNIISVEIPGDEFGNGQIGGLAEIPGQMLQALLSIATDGQKEVEVVVTFESTRVVYDGKAVAAISKAIGTKDAVLNVGTLTDVGKTLNEKQTATVNKEVKGTQLIEITLLADGVAVHSFEDGKATVTVPFDVPAGWQASLIQVYRVEESGEKTAMQTKYENGKVSWETDGHSVYTITQGQTTAQDPQEPQGNNESKQSKFNPTLLIVLIVCAVVVVTVIVIVIVKKKSKKKA